MTLLHQTVHSFFRNLANNQVDVSLNSVQNILQICRKDDELIAQSRELVQTSQALVTRKLSLPALSDHARKLFPGDVHKRFYDAGRLKRGLWRREVVLRYMHQHYDVRYRCFRAGVQDQRMCTDCQTKTLSFHGPLDPFARYLLRFKDFSQVLVDNINILDASGPISRFARFMMRRTILLRIGGNRSVSIQFQRRVDAQVWFVSSFDIEMPNTPLEVDELKLDWFRRFFNTRGPMSAEAAAQTLVAALASFAIVQSSTPSVGGINANVNVSALDTALPASEPAERIVSDPALNPSTAHSFSNT
eukprot:ANDGO_04108.mRNA.2 hypothetical protein